MARKQANSPAIKLIAIGKCRDQPILSLIERYQQRLSVPLSITELPQAAGRNTTANCDDECERLALAAANCLTRIVLDERGVSLSSQEFAAWLNKRFEAALLPIAIIIGGADGLNDRLRDQADLKLSFGRLTWPHMLVRVMIVEQLYRAQTIRLGHPYHRD